MKKLDSLLKRDKGFTLVELLTTLTLTAVVLGMITSVILFGFRSYHKIRIEGEMREEGDLLISSVINEMYTFAPDRIRTMPDSANGIILEKDTEDPAKRQQKVIRITDSGKLQIGEAAEVSITDDAKVLNEDEVPGEDAKTDIQSVIKPEESFVNVECRLLNPCETGLVKIKFVVSRSYEGRNYELGMESKFGF